MFLRLIFDRLYERNESEVSTGIVQCRRLTYSFLESGGLEDSSLFLLEALRNRSQGLGFRALWGCLKIVAVHFSSCSLLTMH